VGLSAYLGNSFHNSFPHDMEGEKADGTKKQYDGVKGTVFIGSIDFTYNRYNWIVRGQADYGTLSDAAAITTVKATRSSIANSPYNETMVGKAAAAVGIEAGYDVFSQFSKLRNKGQKLYAFGRYEYYNSYIPPSNQKSYLFTQKHRMAVGVNYYPIPQIVLKAEYSKRFLKSQYNNEPSINVGVAYAGFFL